MVDLPKRGDRVRVTEVFPGAWLSRGNVVTLESDAVLSRSFGGACEFTYRVSVAHDAVASGPVKVERVSPVFDCERLVREGPRSYACNKPEGHDGPCGSRSPAIAAAEEGLRRLEDLTGASAHYPSPEFTRGMRRALEIAWGVVQSAHPLHTPYEAFLEFKKAVEKELEPISRRPTRP